MCKFGGGFIYCYRLYCCYDYLVEVFGICKNDEVLRSAIKSDYETVQSVAEHHVIGGVVISKYNHSIKYGW